MLTTFVINGKETFECHGDPKRALSLQAESCSDKQVVKMDVSVENICFVRLQQEILDCPYLLQSSSCTDVNFLAAALTLSSTALSPFT